MSRPIVFLAVTVGRPIVAWKALDEIDAGICDGMTYEEIATKMVRFYAIH